MSANLSESFPLRASRVHEACGPGAVAFAAILAARLGCGVLWIQQAWQIDRLHPPGLADLLDPARLLLAHTRDESDSLAVAEEALRDGALPLVVIETTRPLDLREGRRLQLAAKSGRSTGLCLIPMDMGSNAAETRWLCRPVFDPDDSTLHRWEITKNKTGTLGAWHVRWDRTTHRLHVVSPASERPGSARAPG